MADVGNLLKYVEGKMPELAKKNGVDVIVSKWDIVHSEPAICSKDITNEVAMLFEPKKRAIKWIKDIQRHRPASAEEIEKHHDH